MEYVELKAKTVDEAITKACIELGITSDKLDYEVISEGSSGFLGIGSKSAMIRYRKREVPQPESVPPEVFAKEAAKKKKAETGKGSLLSTEDIEARAAAAALRDKELGVKPTEYHDRPERNGRGGRNGRSDRNDRNGRNDRNSRSTDHSNGGYSNSGYSNGGYSNNFSGSYESKNTGRKRDRRGNRKSYEERSSMEGQVIETEKPHEPSVPKPARKITPRTEEEVATMKKAAEEFLSGVFGAMNMNVDMTMEYDQTEGALNCMFNGDDMGILIGKRGQTLDSLQYLTSLVINKDEKEYVRVKLDTEDYRKRRKETLENLARNIAYKVKQTHKAVALEPMNPYERRIIHSALQDDELVETYSEGEEPYRHVVVSMKK